MTFTPNIWDYALLIALIVGNTLLDARFAMPLRRVPVEALPAARWRAYIAVLSFLWGAAACVAALWVMQQRDWRLLYVSGDLTWRLSAGLLLAAAVIALLLMQRAAAIKRVRGNPDKALSFGGGLDALLPRTARELHLFTHVSIAAGVCEELLFRGFLLALLTSLSGLYVGALLAAALFGLCHAYQGVSGIVKTGLFGLVFTIIVVATGSLIPAVIIHIAVDVAGCELSYSLVGDGKAAVLKGAASARTQT